MGFVDELRWRNMLHDMTPGIEDYLNSGVRRAYIGFDPTAPSLGIGNFVQIMILAHFQRSGHQPVVIIGGATGRIGDPSGKDKERDLKTEEELEQNIQAQLKQIKKLLNFETGENKALLINNYDFYKDMTVLHFLRDVGKNASVNTMLAKESVKRRLETGISYTEFSYQLLQAYDFYCLYKDHDCRVQMGGSDQWGNIIAGTDYINKNISEAQAYALTTPLLTKSDGKKFGKTEEGNIWLDPNLTSPYQFYQYWLNVDDADLNKLYRYFSFLNQQEIEQLEKEYKDQPNTLKRIFATELTSRLHGEQVCKNVESVTDILFNKNLSSDKLKEMNEDVFKLCCQEIPSYSLPFESIRQGVPILNLLAEQSQICSSKSQARRAIQGNAIQINKDKISDAEMIISADHFIHEKYLLVENGKKNKFILQIIKP
ncbi:MAG TPA: tyrosine--tRNA ligase [Saprospiraceae bacterium]|nr:tyrosine--tRNA ligase [Saprospiraceae bacterium]